MAIDRSYLERNDTERARLRRLVERASDADLARPIDGGWTVAATLAHLAHWDRGVIGALEEWERNDVQPWGGDADTINAAELPRWQAMPPRAAAQVAVAAAEAVDEKVRSLPDAVVEAILAAGRTRLVDRSLHRRDHLDTLERAVGEAGHR